jgi:hypothetical protein
MFSKTRIVTGLLAITFVALLPLWRFVSTSHAEGANIVYLPLLARNYPPPPTVFGAEVSTFTDPAIIQLAVDANISWLRIPAFDWSQIESKAPVNDIHTYDWSFVPESSLENIAANDMYAIAVVKMAPLWAQREPGVYCGQVARKNFVDFAAFLMAAVQRYSKAPYNVHYWELGNEPDIDPGLVPKDNHFGCWGDEDKYYYGGEYYAEMLKVIYPAIKSIDPQAKVLIGGLLLNCDPGDPQCVDPQPARFFEGILRNGGGKYFDIVSYHGYPYYENGLVIDENHPNWNQRGGTVLGKADFLREVMASYGLDKPLLHTEGALLCPEWNRHDCDPIVEMYETVKSDYVVWLYVEAIANNLEGSIWYTLAPGGWRGSSLIGSVSNPNPTYYVFQFMTEELMGADYIGQPSGVDGALKAYAFRVPGKTVWVVWSVDGIAHQLTLPAEHTRIYDKFGNPLSVTGSILDVSSPIYIELP